MSNTTQRWRHVAAAALIAAALAAPAHLSAASAKAPRAATDGAIVLGVGDAAFWEGEFSASTPLPTSCAIAPDGACIEYPIDVNEQGWRLRVAIDRPYGGGGEFTLQLLDPEGNEHATTADRTRDAFQGSAGFYSSELHAQAPATGRWIARVTARTIEPLAVFRMRAKLEAPPRESPKVRDLLPNLRPLAPYELTFADPGPHSENGCLYDEQVQYGARRCLRFSVGPSNVGNGPLDLQYAAAGLAGRITQRIHRSDGTYREVDGGTFHYHLNHAHYHHDGVGHFELFRVEGRELVKAGEGPKVGYCMGDYLIAEWRSFDQDPARGTEDMILGCGTFTGPTGAALGLGRGWGDVYVWQTSGNYVEFGDNGDGEYVVRMTTNLEGRIQETRYEDNTSYAHIRVTGNDIEMLERGVGTGPADPHKIVTDDTRLPTPPA